MNDLELTVKALTLCVGRENLEKTMAYLRGGGEMPVAVVNRPVERVIGETLMEVGIPLAIKGYRYTVTGVKLLLDHPEMADGITKELYPAIARQHNTISSRVERGIRYAIEFAFTNGNSEVLYRYFRNTVSGIKGKPTNSEFLTLMAEVVRAQLEA